jgi:hypothetical protein
MTQIQPIMLNQLTPKDQASLLSLLNRINDQLPRFVDPDTADSDMIAEVSIELRDMRILKKILNDPTPMPRP